MIPFEMPLSTSANVMGVLNRRLLTHREIQKNPGVKRGLNHTLSYDSSKCGKKNCCLVVPTHLSQLLPSSGGAPRFFNDPNPTQQDEAMALVETVAAEETGCREDARERPWDVGRLVWLNMGQFFCFI